MHLFNHWIAVLITLSRILSPHYDGKTVADVPPPPEPDNTMIEELSATVNKLEEKIDDMAKEIDRKKREKSKICKLLLTPNISQPNIFPLVVSNIIPLKQISL